MGARPGWTYIEGYIRGQVINHARGDMESRDRATGTWSINMPTGSWLTDCEAESYTGQPEAGPLTVNEQFIATLPGNTTPTCRLKGYLEGRSQLISFYNKRTSTELYEDLCKLTQGAGETIQDVLYRGLAFRIQRL